MPSYQGSPQGMNWESHWSTRAHLARERSAYPIHGAPPLAGATAHMSKGMLLGLGTAGVLLGALVGDAGLVMVLKGLGWNP
jgi:hypothetical protein